MRAALTAGALAVAVTLAGCSRESDSTASDTTVAVAPWTERASTLDLPGATDEVPADGSLPDGTYMGALVEGAETGDTPEFVLHRGWFAETCYEVFADEIAAGEGRCLNDIEIVAAGDASVSLAPGASVSLTLLEYDGTEYVVDVATLASIARGEPQADAPTDWQWVPFFFLLEVEDGSAVSATQFWTP